MIKPLMAGAVAAQGPALVRLWGWEKHKNLGFDEGEQKRYSGFRKDDGPLTVQLLIKDTTLRGQD